MAMSPGCQQTLGWQYCCCHYRQANVSQMLEINQSLQWSRHRDQLQRTTVESERPELRGVAQRSFETTPPGWLQVKFVGTTIWRMAANLAPVGNRRSAPVACTCAPAVTRLGTQQWCAERPKRVDRSAPLSLQRNVERILWKTRVGKRRNMRQHFAKMPYRKPPSPKARWTWRWMRRQKVTIQLFSLVLPRSWTKVTLGSRHLELEISMGCLWKICL